MKRTVVGVGNCQVRAITRCAAAALDLLPRYLHPTNAAIDDERLIRALDEAEIIFAQIAWAPIIRDHISKTDRPKRPVIMTPRLYFPGFHPDMLTPVKSAGKFPHLPMGNASSAILLAAWADGLGPDAAVTLFRDEVYEALGYYDVFDAAIGLLADQWAAARVDVRPLIDGWKRPFFYVPLHPKIEVLNDLAIALLRSAKINVADHAPPADDPLANNVTWPVYPEIGERLGVTGDYIFRPNGEVPDRPTEPMTLEEFVHRTFASYRKSPPDLMHFTRMSDPRYQSIGKFVSGRGPSLSASTGWLEADAAAAVQVICDEELLDPGDS